MRKITISISPAYCPEWGVWEIAREVISNALDAKEAGHEYTIDHDGETLVVSSQGVKLDPSVWLLGTSTKRGQKNCRGQFGEGLKIAILAAVRSKMAVQIINNDESWIPALEETEGFPGIEVLTVATEKREPTGAFTVTIGGIDSENWKAISTRFTALDAPETTVKTHHANVLAGATHRGRMYVKGVYVQFDDQLAFGYDFMDTRVDRDRKMVDANDARVSMAQTWIAAGLRTPQLIDSVIVPLLERGAKDVDTLRLSVPDEIGQRIRDLFVEKYGTEAMAVRTPAEALQVGHFGKKGVVLPVAYVTLLEKYMGTLAQHLVTYKNAAEKILEPAELTADEQGLLEETMRLVEEAGNDLGLRGLRDRTEVVVFRENGPNGLHLTDGKIQLGRHLFRDPRELRRVLVHELAHDVGADGSKAHEAMEGRIHAQIQENLLARLFVREFGATEVDGAIV
jgi:hypothetical protein